MPLASPTRTRPPKTVGVPCAVVTPGSPKAHLSLSFGVAWLVSPAAFAFWKRVFAASAQPFHAALFEREGGPEHCDPCAAEPASPVAIRARKQCGSRPITYRS